MTTNRLDGQRIWIIGASSGIGAAVAREAARQGARVAVSARHTERLVELAAEAPRGMTVAAVDVTDRAVVGEAFAEVEAALGPLDIVVMSAGYWKQMSARHFDLAEFDRHVQVNLMGLANCVDAVLPSLIARQHGLFAGIASVAGYRGLPGAEGYGTAKAAQIHLLESLRAGLRGSGVQVQTICPGFVDTPMTASNDFPMPFCIEPQEAAEAIIEGLVDRAPEVVFPWQMAVVMKAARVVPQQLWAWLAGRVGSTEQ